MGSVKAKYGSQLNIDLVLRWKVSKPSPRFEKLHFNNSQLKLTSVGTVTAADIHVFSFCSVFLACLIHTDYINP